MRSATDTDTPSHGPTLAFHGGLLGALAPFFLFLGGVMTLGLLGAPDERGFWPVLVAAIGLGLALARDRTAYSDALVRGMSQPLVALMIMAWLLAGVLASLMQAGGVVDALVALAREAGVGGGGYAVAAFLIGCAVSTATGTSLGTILLCAPLLYPAGAALGTSAAPLMGAILAGATFGDNVSPVSDTTIASAGTQKAAMGAVVRSRLRYALPAAAAAMIVFAITGAASDPTQGSTAVADARLDALWLLLAPAVTLFLLLRGRHLFVGLLAGAATAIAVGLVTGAFTPAALLHLDHDAFIARGLLLDGLERGIGISIFTLLLMGLVGGLDASGVLGRLTTYAERRTHGPRGAEVWTFALVSAAVMLTTHAVVAILTIGPFTRRTGTRHALSATRRANLLDVTVCTYPFLLPWFIPTILASAATVTTATANGAASVMPRLSPWTVGLWNVHSWALWVLIVFAITTGWGRSR